MCRAWSATSRINSRAPVDSILPARLCRLSAQPRRWSTMASGSYSPSHPDTFRAPACGLRPLPRPAPASRRCNAPCSARSMTCIGISSPRTSATGRRRRTATSACRTGRCLPPIARSTSYRNCSPTMRAACCTASTNSTPGSASMRPSRARRLAQPRRVDAALRRRAAPSRSHQARLVLRQELGRVGAHGDDARGAHPAVAQTICRRAVPTVHGLRRQANAGPGPDHRILCRRPSAPRLRRPAARNPRPKCRLGGTSYRAAIGRCDRTL